METGGEKSNIQVIQFSAQIRVIFFCKIGNILLCDLM